MKKNHKKKKIHLQYFLKINPHVSGTMQSKPMFKGQVCIYFVNIDININKYILRYILQCIYI